MPVFEEKARSPFGRGLLELEIASELSFKEPVIIRILRTLRQEACLNATDAERVQLCLDEAIKNAILHGNRLQPEKKVRFRLFADDEKWGLVIEDEGEGMKPKLVPEAATKDFRESGYGIMLLDSILDEVVYMGRGNELLLVRKRSEPTEAEKGAAGAVAQVSAMTDEEMEQAQYVTKAAETDVPASLDFDLGDLGAPTEAAAPKEETKAAKAGIVGAKLESETGTLRIHRKDGGRILELLPRQISDYNLDQVREQVSAACKGEKLVVLDLRNVNYVSSVVLGAFVNLHKELTQAGSTLRISSPTATVLDVLKVTRLNRLFSIYPDPDAAILARE
jgi:serine/threonine-protein kinase RsbW